MKVKKVRRKNYHVCVQAVYDLLYLDDDGFNEFYNPDKQWDADLTALIAEVVGMYIPRPTERREVTRLGTLSRR